MSSTAAELARLCTLNDAGLLTPVVERVWPLASAAEVEAHIETKRTRGKVAVTLETAISHSFTRPHVRVR